MSWSTAEKGIHQGRSWPWIALNAITYFDWVYEHFEGWNLNQSVREEIEYLYGCVREIKPLGGADSALQVAYFFNVFTGTYYDVKPIVEGVTEEEPDCITLYYPGYDLILPIIDMGPPLRRDSAGCFRLRDDVFRLLGLPPSDHGFSEEFCQEFFDNVNNFLDVQS
jgi:hypothetical protein